MWCINVKTQGGDTIELEVKPADKVGFLKQLIKEKMANAVETQHLLFKNKGLDDNKTLEQSGLENNAIVHLRIDLYEMINVIAMDAKSEETSYSMRFKDKVELLRNKISANYKENKGIILTFNGVMLRDDKSLEEVGIENNSTVQVAIRYPGGLTDQKCQSLMSIYSRLVISKRNLLNIT